MQLKITSLYGPKTQLILDFGKLDSRWRKPLQGNDSREIIVSKDNFLTIIPELDTAYNKNGIKVKILGKLLADEQEMLETLEVRFVQEMLKEYKLSPQAKFVKERLREGILSPPIIKETTAMENSNIFIVHGHDEIIKLKVERLVAKLGLEPIILHDQPNNGKTIIEKFEKNAMNAAYAIVLMTPDDAFIGTTGIKISRARQNVILEWGLFCCKTWA